MSNFELPTRLENALKASGNTGFVDAIEKKSHLQQSRDSIAGEIHALLDIKERTDQEATLLLYLSSQINTIDGELSSLFYKLMAYQFVALQFCQIESL